MSWVRLDDGAPGHRKIVGLSDAAFRLWIVGLTYCNQQANDGRFSAASARIMTETLRLDSSDVARALNVSHPTVSRIRMGHSQPSGPTAKLIQVLWPKWWPFLTEQTNELPEV